MDIGARFPLFWKAYFNPEQVFASEAAKNKVPMSEGLINNALAFLIVPILMVLLSLLGASPNAMAGIVVGLVIFAALLILVFIVAALYHFIAGLLGGKGSLEKSYYVLSIFNAVGVFSYIVLIVFYLLALLVMQASAISAIVVLPIVLIVAYTVVAYLFYILGIAVKSAHQVSSLKGIFAMMVALGIVFAVILAVLFAMFGGMVLGALAGAGKTGGF